MDKFRIGLLATLIMVSLTPCFAQGETKSKTLKDLDFLIGIWDITFEIYDTYKPERGVIFTEKGTLKCYYELPKNGKNQLLTCQGEMVSDDGIFRDKKRTRTFRESVRVGKFVPQDYERIGLYSNWPATGLETMDFDAKARILRINGQLKVQHGRLERYEDIYQFNEDFSYYDRINVANFSDMPLTVYNLTLKGTGKKRND